MNILVLSMITVHSSNDSSIAIVIAVIRILAIHIDTVTIYGSSIVIVIAVIISSIVAILINDVAAYN